MFTSTDFDKLRQITAENPEHQALISKLLDSHNESLRTITHEIRNPLTLVYSTLQLIESAHPEVLSFRYWDSLNEDVTYMIDLLTELSTYNNGTALQRSYINVSEFFQRIALSFAASIADRKIEFTSWIDPDLPTAAIDSVKMKEVLLNLLRNASESIPPDHSGSIRMDVTINNGLSIQITDSGCGISPDHLNDIFHPFVTYKPGGTGLGLPLSKRIVEAHGGSLEVSSTLEVGTTFRILLPIE